MTERVFDDNPLQETLSTEILSINHVDGGFLAELKSTIFFPRGGGQPCEGGTICGIPVLDVFEEDGIIYHKMEAAPTSEIAICKIDIDARKDHMRHHTAQHIISAAAEKLFNNSTLIARIEDDFAHIEFEREMNLQELALLKRETMKIIAQDINLKCGYYAPEAAAQMDIRGKITPHSLIRVVDIEGFDKNACGGTHCANTADIKNCEFTAIKRVRGAFRLYFVAGVRARMYSEAQEIRTIEMGEIMGAISPIELKESIMLQKASVLKLTEENASLKKQLGECDAEILSNAGDKIGEISYISRDYIGRQTKQLRTICENLLKTERAVILLSNVSEGTMGVLLMQHKSVEVGDFGMLLKSFLAEFGGKGGGSKMMAQGELEYSEGAQKAFDLLRAQIKSLI